MMSLLISPLDVVNFQNWLLQKAWMLRGAKRQILGDGYAMAATLNEDALGKGRH